MPTKKKTLVRKEKCDLKTEDYADMFDYYQSIYGLIDLFHFNSTVSQNVYCSYLPEIRNFAILPISHAAIIDQKVIKHLKSSSREVSRMFSGFLRTPAILFAAWGVG